MCNVDHEYRGGEMETKPGHSREDYEACLKYAAENNYRAMYNAMAEDGYDPSVNWRKLMDERRKP